MIDMLATIQPKSDQLNADDLIGGPRTIRVTKVCANAGNPDQPINIFFDGDDGKPYRPCKSMRRVIVAAWGPNAPDYVGRSMTLYLDPKVMFGGMAVGGIRISHMSHLDRKLNLALTVTKAKRAGYEVLPLAGAPTKPAPDQQPASSKSPTHDLDLLGDARKAARQGTEAFRAWWKAHADDREVVRPHMDELQALAKDADEKAASDPFGLPPIEHPTAEDMARAEAEALAAIDQEETE